LHIVTNRFFETFSGRKFKEDHPAGPGCGDSKPRGMLNQVRYTIDIPNMAD
jgi:hypothetical protein